MSDLPPQITVPCEGADLPPRASWIDAQRGHVVIGVCPVCGVSYSLGNAHDRRMGRHQRNDVAAMLRQPTVTEDTP